MSTNKVTFFSLPLDIRLQIYRFCLVRGCPVNLNLEGERLLDRHKIPNVQNHICLFEWKGLSSWPRLSLPRRIDCVCRPFFVALLRVCRSIYTEALPVMYSENHLTILGSLPLDLGVISSLSDLALTSMTSMLIRLNCWPCRRGHDDTTYRNTICLICDPRMLENDPPLREEALLAELYLNTWESICHRLAANLKPDQLRLTFICDTEGIKVAEGLMKALLKLPTLRECNIRLGRNRDARLQKLAKSTADDITGVSPKVFHLFEILPPELQLRILNFTHLGSGGNFDSHWKDLVIMKNKLCYSDNMRENPCCRACNGTAANCCCSTRNAAWSQCCKCRQIPWSLFY